MKKAKKKVKETPVPGPNVLGAYIATEVTHAQTDYDTVRSRALALITSSGALVTLISGLLAISFGTAPAFIPKDSRWTVAVALGAFIVSTVFALLINLPQIVNSSDAGQLGELVANHWDEDGWDKSVAGIQVIYLTSLKKDNARSARLIKVSVFFQIIGIAFIGVTAFLIIMNFA